MPSKTTRAEDWCFHLDKVSTTTLFTLETCRILGVSCELHWNCRNSRGEYLSEDELREKLNSLWSVNCVNLRSYKVFEVSYDTTCISIST